MDREAVLVQIDAVLARCALPGNALPDGRYFEQRPDAWLVAQGTAILALLDRLSGANSSYRRAAQAKLDEGFPLAHSYTLAHLVGVLTSLRADVEAGFTQSFEELVHRDVFDDFLTMADELLDKGYISAAAVLAGSVLEEHARKLCVKNSLDVQDAKGHPKSLDAMAIELVKEGAVSEPERKIIVGWYGQRTQAAHGHPENVVEGHVRSMPAGIREFMVRHPA